MTVKHNIISCEVLSAGRNGMALTQPVSFSLARGQFVQLRGANGCGKSTFLRHLAGLLPALHGTILIDDAPQAAHQIATRRGISYLGHADGLHGDLSAYENYELLTGESRIMLVQSALYERPVATYSAGQRQKLTIHMLNDDHDFWLLDEPAASLDDANLRHLEERIAGYLANGGAVIASTHTPLGEGLVTKVITLTPFDHNEGGHS